ncbi:MAG TPA: hypothetical protein VK436_03475 [Methanocella sp.]|nr:hypothetical protein [Methanocella sp.]
MVDSKNVPRDMFRQRVMQAITGITAVAGLSVWVFGYWWGEYLSAAAIIFFTVATLRWLDDEEVVEKEHLTDKKR